MSEVNCCQSCGLPFDEGHRELRAVEPDGSPGMYCTYCRANGEFLQPDATVEDIIGYGVPHLAAKMGEAAARAELARFIPTLARWRH